MSAQIDEALAWRPELYRYALRLMGGNETDADDLVQETYLRSWQHLGRLPVDAVHRYLKVAMRNTSRDWSRRAWRRDTIPLSQFLAHLGDEFEGEPAIWATDDWDPARLIDELAGEIETRTQVWATLGKLKPSHQEALISIYMQEEKQVWTSQRKAMAHRARQAFAERWTAA